MTARTYDYSVRADIAARAMPQACDLARTDHPNAARVEAISWRRECWRVQCARRVTTNNVPGFYAPWTGPAKAYPVAESVQAALQGLRRARKQTMFHLVVTSPDAARPCAGCGRPCAEPSPDRAEPDRYATGYYLPKTKMVALMHYTCSWGATMQAVYEWGARMR